MLSAEIGDVLMISEGRSGVDNVYSLRNGWCWHPDQRILRSRLIFPGILRLELDKASYEKAGLVGKPIRSGGRKHEKSRYRTLGKSFPSSRGQFNANILNLSRRNKPPSTIHAAWEERLRTNRLGLQKCVECISNVAIL